MKFDKIKGLWTELKTEVSTPPDDASEPEELEDEAEIPIPKEPPPPVKGSCILSIRIENRGEYLKWQKYNPGYQWEFIVTYPALMRAKYEFKNALDVEMITKKIVQLLQMGFDVYSASWKLEEQETKDEGEDDV